jgi:hypothetical protein
MAEHLYSTYREHSKTKVKKCQNESDFVVSINRWMLLITWKPRNQEFTAEVITLRKFYDHHHNMVNTYGVTIQLSCPLSWLTYHYKRNTTGAVGGAGTDFPSGTHDFTSGF